MLSRQLAGQLPCRNPVVMLQRRAPLSLTQIQLPARTQPRRSHAVPVTALAQPQQHETAQYCSAPASNFASLDSLELERLHAQLKSAYSWLDISASVSDYSAWMVDEASVVAALVRLSAIYSHLGDDERAEVRASGLVERLAAMAERRLPALTPQQLAETLDALARLEFHAPKSFLKAADRQAQAKLDGFAPAQLPLLLCALAALGQEPGAALVNAVGEALAHQELQVAPGDVARMLVACAGLATPPPAQVLRGLASALRRQLDSFRPAELSQAIEAMVKLRFHPGKDVLARVAARAGLRSSRSRPQRTA